LTKSPLNFRSRAQRSVVKLVTINSDFNIPSDIRSEVDEILSRYDSYLENIEHKCIPFISMGNVFREEASKVRNLVGGDFMRKNNNDFIKEKLQKIEQQLSKIIGSD